jgi:DNA-directed RNA polymerase subunit RPC12/RpoP
LTGDELETKEEYICPKCGYQLTIPTRPSDSKVRRIWSLYCPPMRPQLVRKNTGRRHRIPIR